MIAELIFGIIYFGWLAMLSIGKIIKVTAKQRCVRNMVHFTMLLEYSC